MRRKTIKTIKRVATGTALTIAMYAYMGACFINEAAELPEGYYTENIEERNCFEAVNPPSELLTDIPEVKPVYSINAEDKYLLAKIAMAEAEDEPFETKEYVVLTVLNRVESNKFANSVRGVIYEPRQFTPIYDGRWNAVEPSADCWAAVDEVMSLTEDPSQGALYFEASKKGSSWHSRHLTYLFKSGKTRFYK